MIAGLCILYSSSLIVECVFSTCLLNKQVLFSSSTLCWRHFLHVSWSVPLFSCLYLKSCSLQYFITSYIRLPFWDCFNAELVHLSKGIDSFSSHNRGALSLCAQDYSFCINAPCACFQFLLTKDTERLSSHIMRGSNRSIALYFHDHLVWLSEGSAGPSFKI